MKTKCYYFQFIVTAFRTCLRLIALIFMVLMIAQVDARAEGLLDPCAESAWYGQTYYATLSFAPAMSTSTTEITIKTLFDGLPGFESAELVASLVGGGSVLNATLSGFSGQYLPDDAVLGIITLNDGSTERTFLVVSDGGVLIVDEVAL